MFVYFQIASGNIRTFFCNVFSYKWSSRYYSWSIYQCAEHRIPSRLHKLNNILRNIFLPHIFLYMFCSNAHVIQHIPCNRMGLPILPCNRIGFDNNLRLQLPNSQMLRQYTRLG